MNLKKFLKAFLGRRKIKSQLLKADPVRIIFGAGGTNYVGWVSTDYPALDVTDQKSWASLFKFGQIDALLSEHVLEHLDDDQVVSAIENIHKYLKKGGYVRIAVPDGCHPNPEYIEAVKPGGSGLGSEDHKQLFNYQTMSALLKERGFSVELLEWFDEQGAFNCIDWSAHDGMVTRSSRNDERNLIRPLSYTSLIVDAYKS
jgi:predicted SAM-dependent methyltransferase